MTKRPRTATADPTARHPIAVVAERTGLSRDVLRVWERRYRAVAPTRSAGGQRLYSDEDVARFRLLAAATKGGRSIGQVAPLSSDELAHLVAGDELARPAVDARAAAKSHEEIVLAAMEFTRELRVAALDRELRRAIATHGLPAFLEVIVPGLMQRVGDEWHARRLSIAHEHLASMAVLAVVLDSLRAVPEAANAPRILFATPSGARHLLGAAVAAAAAALDGWSVVHLGADVPAADVVRATAECGASAVAMSVVYTDDAAATERDLLAVREGLPPHVRFIVGGAATERMAGLRDATGVVACATIAEFRTVLERERAA